MKLYGFPISPFVRKTRVALELKGIKYQLIDTYPGTRTPEYLAISPLGKIPALDDDGLIMCDSNVIVEYLEEKYPDIPVRPTGIAERVKSRWLEEYAASQLFDPCAEDIFMERLTKPFMSKQPCDESVVQNSINNRIPPLFDYLESQLPQQGFIFAQLGVADIAVATALINAIYTEFEIDAQQWPKLAAHLQLVKDHPVVQKCMATEAPIIAALKNARQQASA